MPKIACKLIVNCIGVSAPAPDSRGINVTSEEEVREFAEAAGLAIPDDFDEEEIEIELPEDSPEFARLIELIASRYGYTPYYAKIIPATLREQSFGIVRTRKFSAAELAAADFLCLEDAGKVIANFKNGTPEQFDKEIYVVEKNRYKKKVQMGALAPFHGIAVTRKLKDALQKSGLIGLEFSPVINGNDIWKLGSSIFMPRCSTKLVNGKGDEVQFDEWSDILGLRLFDDEGFRPCQLSFRTDEVEEMGEFDIAMTQERTGPSLYSSFRDLIVSQRFRQELEGLKIPGVRYVPIRRI